MYRIKDFFARLANGRYGVDELYKFFMSISLVLIIINIFVRSYVFDIVILLLFFVMIFRCFSRNFYRRQRENSVFLKFRDLARSESGLLKKRWRDRNTHIYRRCPNCRAVIKLPRKKGRHICGCPKCGKDFKVKCR